MKEYKLSNGNKAIIKTGQIEEETGDVLVSFCAQTLQHGLPTFYRIMKKAGHQVPYSMLSYDGKMKQSDCFTTIPGFVDFNVILHSVMPLNSNLFNNSFFNIVSTLKVYAKENVCRDVFLFVPTSEIVPFFNNFLTYESQLEELTFYFILDEEKEEKRVIDFLDKTIKESFAVKFLNKLKYGTNRIRRVFSNK